MGYLYFLKYLLSQCQNWNDSWLKHNSESKIAGRRAAFVDAVYALREFVFVDSAIRSVALSLQPHCGRVIESTAARGAIFSVGLTLCRDVAIICAHAMRSSNDRDRYCVRAFVVVGTR